MQNQNDSENTSEISKEVPETTTEQPAEKTEEVKGLSARDALEVAIASTRKEEKEDKPSRAPRKTVIDDKKPEEKKAAQPPLEAPAEYSRDEREDFNALSRKQQEASLRLHKSRNSYLEQIKRESAELQWSRDLAKQVEPFLKIRGDKEPTHQQLLKALKVINKIDDNPKEALAQIMQAKGITVPRELLEQDNAAPKALDEKITPLQSRLEALERRIVEEENQKVGAVYVNAFTNFSSAKNAGGAPKFPDINNTESGLRLSTQIGSLVGGQSDLSKQFIASVQSRIPEATLETLYSEAYKFYGGKVDEQQTARSQDATNHIYKSSRAAASVMPNGARSASSDGVKRFSSNRDALAAAFAELKNQG